MSIHNQTSPKQQMLLEYSTHSAQNGGGSASLHSEPKRREYFMERNAAISRSPDAIGMSSATLSLRAGGRLSPSTSGIFQKQMYATTQTYQRFEKENQSALRQSSSFSGIKSVDGIQKRLDQVFASTKNFIYSASKIKSQLFNVLQQNSKATNAKENPSAALALSIDFDIKIFEADKTSLEKSLFNIEHEIFGMKESALLSSSSSTDHLHFNPFDRKKSQQQQQMQQQQQVSEEQQQQSQDNFAKLKKQNQDLKNEVTNLKEEIERVMARGNLLTNEISAANVVGMDSVLFGELEQLKKQVGRIEKKAGDRKVCIKKLYTILEAKDKEIEVLKKYQQKFPIQALVQFITKINSADSSKKLQGYIDMALKQEKLQKLMVKETKTLTPDKKKEIQDMIRFLQGELSEILDYFTRLISGAGAEKLAQEVSPKTRKPAVTLNNVVMAATAYSVSNFDKPSQISLNKSKERFSLHDNEQHQTSQHARVTSPPPQYPQQLPRNESSKKVEMNSTLVQSGLVQAIVLILEELGVNVPHKNDESKVIAQLRDEVQVMVKKVRSEQRNLQEIKDILFNREQDILLREEKELELKNEVLRFKEASENNPKVQILEEKISQLKKDARSKAEEQRELERRMLIAEQDAKEFEMVLGENKELQMELQRVQLNLNEILENNGIAILGNSDTVNVDNVLDSLREYFDSNNQKIHLHKHVYEDMEKRFFNASSEVQKLNEAYSDCIRSIEEQESINSALNEELQQVKENLIRTQLEKEEAGENQLRLKKKMEEKEVKKSKEIEKLNLSLEKLNANLLERNDVIMNMKLEIQSLEEICENKEQIILQMDSELKQIMEERFSANQEQEQYKEEIKKRNDEMINKVSSMEKVQKKLNRRNIELEEEMKQARENEIRLEVALEKSKKQLEAKELKNLEVSGNANNPRNSNSRIAEVSQQEKEIEGLRASLVQIEQENLMLKDNINHFSTSVAQEQQMKQEENEELQVQLEQAMKKIEQLSGLQEYLEQISQENANLIDELAFVKNQQQQTNQAQNAQIQSEIQEQQNLMQQKLNEASQKSEQFLQNLREMELLLEQSKDKVTSYEQQLSVSHARVAELEFELTNQEQIKNDQVRSLLEQNSQQQALFGKIQEKSNTLEEELQTTRREMNKKEATIASLQQALDLAKQEIAAYLASSSSSLSEQQEQLRILQQEFISTKTSLNEQSQLVKKYEAEKNELLSELGQSKEINSNLSVELQQRQDHANQVEGLLDVKFNEINQLQHQISFFEKEIESNKNALSQKEGEINQLKQNTQLMVNSLNDEMKHLSEQLDHSSKEVQMLSKRCQEIEFTSQQQIDSINLEWTQKIQLVVMKVEELQETEMYLNSEVTRLNQVIAEQAQQLEEAQQKEVFVDEFQMQNSNRNYDHNRGDRSEREKETALSSRLGATVGAAPAEVNQSRTKMSLNLASIPVFNDNVDDGRMKIQRKLENTEQIPKNNPQFDVSDDEEEAEQFKDQLVKQQAATIESQKIEIDERQREVSELKGQIDLMFADLNANQEYIQYLEGMNEDLKQQLQSAQQQALYNNVPVAAPPAVEVVPQQNNENSSVLQAQVEALRKELTEMIQVNEELEKGLEEKERIILNLQENNQGGEAAEEAIGQLQEQLEKQKQKVRRHEEDLAYQQSIIQNLNKQIEEIKSKKGEGVSNGNNGEEDNEEIDEDDEEIEGGLVDHLSQNAEKPSSFVGNNKSALSGGAFGGAAAPPLGGASLNNPQYQRNFSSNEDQGKSGSNFQIDSNNEDYDLEDVGGGNHLNNYMPHNLNKGSGSASAAKLQARHRKSNNNNNQNNNMNGGAGNSATMTTQEAEEQEQQLILEKINIQQQIAELKSEGEIIPTEDQIRIQHLTRLLEVNKNRFDALYRNKNTRQHALQDINAKFLDLNQKFKELKEEREKIWLENKALKQQVDALRHSKSPSKGSSSLEEKQRKATQAMVSALKKRGISRTTLDDIEILVNDLIGLVDGKDSSSFHRSPKLSQEEADRYQQQQSSAKRDSKLPAHSLSGVAVMASDNVIGAPQYSQLIEGLLENILLGRPLPVIQNLSGNIKDKLEFYLDLWKDKSQELMRERNSAKERIAALSAEIEALKQQPKNNALKMNANQNMFLRKSGGNPASAGSGALMMADPFVVNDNEIIAPKPRDSHVGGSDNFDDENNQSSFLSMSEQIIKDLEAGDQARDVQQKQQNQSLSKVNGELKLQNEHYELRLNQILDEIKVKDDIIMNTEAMNRTLKNEMRKLKESTEAISQKEHIKIIFLQYIASLSDKKKIPEADNFLNILFSMLGVSEPEKEDVHEKLGPKLADKKKSISSLIIKK